jgi:hypothetical protein
MNSSKAAAAEIQNPFESGPIFSKTSGLSRRVHRSDEYSLLPDVMDVLLFISTATPKDNCNSSFVSLL